MVKDPLKTKGARLSMELTIAGRYMVYAPTGEGVGVSRRLEDRERERLRRQTANLVLDGAGSSEDSARVAHWFEQAAASGDLVAAFNLGLCLDKGIGVEPDAQQAAHWLRRAAEGVPEAQYMYGRMLAEGTPAALALGTADGSIRFSTDPGIDTAGLALTMGSGATVEEERPGSYRLRCGVGAPTPEAVAALAGWLAEAGRMDWGD